MSLPLPMHPHLEIRHDPDAQDLDVIHAFLSEQSTWAKGIPRELVEESVRNSLNVGLFVDGRQVGYARVISDYATFAYVLDVFVLAAHRGNGYSRRLMEAVLSHPRLQGLRRIVLVSSTARDLYGKFGFAPLQRPETYMEINRPDLYSRGDIAGPSREK
jgi:GNAT superfamily N-acetyltransferase